MAFCANCGAAVDGRFCQKCGAPVATPGAPVPPTPGAQPLQPVVANSVSMTDNMAGALCYLFGFITGILFLVLTPYNQNRTIRFHAFQSIFLNIAWFAAWIVITIIMIPFHYIPHDGLAAGGALVRNGDGFLGLFISIVLHAALGLGAFILWLYLMFKTYNGEKIVLPVVGPFADKQAGA